MKPQSPIGLRQWIWRAFLKSALIPLVLVETLLIGVYLLSNSAIRDTQVGYLRDSAVTELQSAVRGESHIVQEQLEQIADATELYRNLASQALAGGLQRAEALATSPDGVRFSPQDDGNAASFYSSYTPLAQQDLGKVARLATLDPLMRELTRSMPLVASIYFNAWDSYNRIYPWFRTDEQYPHDMHIPAFNFYYLADASNNPARKVVWTDVYLDPAGQGWMMSAIAPVYRDDFLEGVVGLDVTVSGILEHIGELSLPWDGYTVLVSDQLNIMALPAAGEADFGLSELTGHSYAEAIRQEVFKPEDFNLGAREQTRVLGQAMAHQEGGAMPLMLGGHSRLVAWHDIEQTGWKLLAVVDEDAVYARTDALAMHYQNIGYLLIAGLLLFYLAYFCLLWWRTRTLSEALRAPIDGISRMMDEIGEQRWRPQPVQSSIAELQRMGEHTANMGLQLEHSERRRDAAQRRLELVMESASEGLWELDLARQRLALRGRVLARFGLPEQLEVAQFVDSLHPADRRHFEDALKQAQADGAGRFEAEFRFLDRHAQTHWLLARGRVLERDAHGQPQTLAGTLVDIQRIKAVEEALRQASEQAQAASQSKSRFISSMSHELRTPLNAIQGFAQLLEMDQRAGHSGSEHVAEILTAAGHLNQLVADILDWSSIQSGQAGTQRRPLEVAPVMRECAEMVRLETRRQGLQLELQLPAAPLQVLADARRLRQVLLNLLSNAIKYNRPDGRVTLGCERLGTRLRLFVEDSGLGIEPVLQAQLFEPFQRLGRENTAIQGTGIGLALCREYAEAMGGGMGVQSVPQQGSRFWIELPLVQGADALGVRPQVFYVEDSEQGPQVSAALAEFAEVQLYRDGLSAREALLQHPPQLLLLDLTLPGLAAAELLATLRANPLTEALPVVILCLAQPDALARAAALDCQGLLAKPLDLEELRRLVAALLTETAPHA